MAVQAKPGLVRSGAITTAQTRRVLALNLLHPAIMHDLRIKPEESGEDCCKPEDGGPGGITSGYPPVVRQSIRSNCPL